MWEDIECIERLVVGSYLEVVIDDDSDNCIQIGSGTPAGAGSKVAGA